MPVPTHSSKEFSVTYNSGEEFEDFAKSLAGFSFGKIDVEDAGLFINILSIN
jgi:hypothetical protein